MILLITGIILLMAASSIVGWWVGNEKGWMSGYRDALQDQKAGIRRAERPAR